MDRLGPLGRDPSTVLTHQFHDQFGGAPANVACALARLGTSSTFVGRLGIDATGNSFANLMAKLGVGLAGLQRDDVRPTRTVLVRRQMDGDRIFHGFVGDHGNGLAFAFL